MGTRERLLGEALKLFASRGYDAVGVQEVVAAAGVTKPSLYHHFGSKQGLLEALLESHFAELFERLEPAMQYAGDLPLTLFRTARVLFDHAARDPTFHRMQLAMLYSAPDSVQHAAVAPYVRRLQQRLEALFQSVVEDHGNLRGHHVIYAITLLGMIDGYIVSLAEPGAETSDEVVRQVVKQFMYGIYAL
jgi:AcrR family transcriptional regulator